MRSTGYLLVAVLGAGGVYLAARPHPGPPAPLAEPVPSTIVVEPSPDSLATLPARHDLTVSTAVGEPSFIAFGGHILLFMRVTYGGSAPVRVVDGRVPQAGAYPDLGAGGLTAGTSANIALRKGVPTEVFIRTRVDCSTVLAGPPVDHVDLVTQPDGAVPRAQVIDLTGLDTYWDEARHAACTRPDAAHDLAETVSGVRGVPGNAGRAPWVEGVLALHDRAGFDAVVTLSDVGPSTAFFTAATLTSAGAVVEGGATYVTPVRWMVTDCAVEQTQPAPDLPAHVTINESAATVPGNLGPSFAAAWRLALLQACR